MPQNCADHLRAQNTHLWDAFFSQTEKVSFCIFTDVSSDATSGAARPRKTHKERQRDDFERQKERTDLMRTKTLSLNSTLQDCSASASTEDNSSTAHKCRNAQEVARQWHLQKAWPRQRLPWRSGIAEQQEQRQQLSQPKREVWQRSSSWSIAIVIGNEKGGSTPTGNTSRVPATTQQHEQRE